MNIFVFNEGAWDNKSSFGNTISNWFTGKIWEKDQFLDFYTRFRIPENDVNVRYYRLTPFDILKGICRGKIRGTEFTTDDIPNMRNAMEASAAIEQNRIDKIHAGDNQLIYLAHELIWISGLWKNKQLKNFIRENNPDIFFAFAGGTVLLWPMIQYIKKNAKSKIVLFISDDFYGAYSKLPVYRSWYLRAMLKTAILEADMLYAVSDEMSELYETKFGKPVTTLYKGCDLSLVPKQHLNQPLRIVYAGNLMWGRDDTLDFVADALEKVNKDGLKATLEIYTGNTITEQLQKKLNRGCSSQIMGSRAYGEIKQIMHEADVVLHVESFEEKEKELVQYSFSTKIIDCLQSGAQVLGIGPKGIASIEYLRKVDGAIVIDTQIDIQTAVEKIVTMQDEIINNSWQTRAYALQHHDIETVQHDLRTQFEELLNS